MMKEKLDRTKLLKVYSLRRPLIQSRLSEFSQERSDKEIFKELCFCILTANGTAKSGINCIAALGNGVFTGSEEEIYKVLKGRCRWTNRAAFIVRTRKHLQDDCNMRLSKKIKSFNNPNELRDFFAKNTIGFGYKESSHFLRNIGFSGFAILDKHIINSLHELGVLKTTERPKSRQHYLEMEAKMKDFSKEIGIPMDELDLLLWSYKTGEILK